MNTAKIIDLKNGRFGLSYKGKVIIRSGNPQALIKTVELQKDARVLKHKITKVEVESITAFAPAGNQVTTVASNVSAAISDSEVPNSQFSINERFAFMEDLINMVIKGDAKSVLISGQGGIGKTYTVLDCLKKAGLTDMRSIMPSINDLDEIVTEDDEDAIERKITSQMSRPKGDYIVIKGHASAKALYRLMYENRNELLVFDDCDGVLKDATALMMFKGALDSYDERWVSWYAESLGDTDLPKTFKFTGRIIFISNMSMNKIDDAVKTRAFKIDVSMTAAQRIERMEAVLEGVMPHIDMPIKVDALNLVKELMNVAREVNFRALQRVITIRSSKSEESWKNLAKFSLIEG